MLYFCTLIRYTRMIKPLLKYINWNLYDLLISLSTILILGLFYIQAYGLEFGTRWYAQLYTAKLRGEFLKGSFKGCISLLFIKH